MKRFLAFLALVLVLAACAPAAVPTFERDGETVTVTITANEPLFDVTVSILGASTDDERCIALGEADLGCVLGNIPAGAETYVIVTSEPDAFSCVAFAYLEPANLTTYRPFPCKATGVN